MKTESLLLFEKPRSKYPKAQSSIPDEMNFQICHPCLSGSWCFFPYSGTHYSACVSENCLSVSNKFSSCFSVPFDSNSTRTLKILTVSALTGVYKNVNSYFHWACTSCGWWIPLEISVPCFWMMFLQRHVSTEKHVATGSLYVVVKITVDPIHATKTLEMSLHSFLTWTLDGGGWSNSRTGRLFPAKESWYSFNRKFCRLQTRSGRFRRKDKFLLPPGINP